MVTIAIVGLLVVIALVSFSGQTDKARIAKTLQWSRSIEHLLGADAVGIWTFDEGSGTTAIDSSGYGNDGTIYGASYTTDTPSGYGYALEFNGMGDYVRIQGDFDPRNLSLSMWVNIDENQTWSSRFDIFSGTSSGGNGRFLLYRVNETILQFYIQYSSNIYSRNIPDSVDNLVGKWAHLIFISSDSNNEAYMQIYVNGTADTLINVNHAYDYINQDLYLMSNLGGSNFTNGLIDDVRIYETALTSVQVEALYYVGLDSLYNKGLIDEQEYQKRMVLGLAN
jgi:hypothetical protein